MIRVADIERLRPTMENVPEHHAEEVTTMQAVQMLASQIHGMQAKGYGLPAIAELMSENGVVVTAKTLKTYLGEARAAGGRKNRRKIKARRPATEAAAATPKTQSKPPVVVTPSSVDAQPGARIGAKGASPATIPPTRAVTLAATKGTAGTTRQGDEAAMRRSTFVPKEDTRDI
jgi:hypothetical protein